MNTVWSNIYAVIGQLRAFSYRIELNWENGTLRQQSADNIYRLNEEYGGNPLYSEAVDDAYFGLYRIGLQAALRLGYHP